MSDVQFKPGQFCWWELTTSDANGAKEFYSSLFDWTARDVPMGEGFTYTMLEKDGKQAAALFQMDSAMSGSGIPPNWGSYIGVEDADATATKAKELDGKVLMEPSDVMSEGRMAVIEDPTGAVFKVWEPKNHKGAAYTNDVGGVVWNELMTPDPTKAGKFYGNLFGYDVSTVPFGEQEYTILAKGETQTAGVMEMSGDMWTGIPPHWMSYFAVESAQQSVDKAVKLGGQVKVPPTPIPGVGTFAVIADPQGAVFSLLEPTQDNGQSDN